MKKTCMLDKLSADISYSAAGLEANVNESTINIYRHDTHTYILNHQQEKTEAYWMREDICKCWIQYGVKIENI